MIAYAAVAHVIDTVGGLSFDFTEEQDLFRRSLRELVDAEFSKEYCREVGGREPSSHGSSGRSSATTA